MQPNISKQVMVDGIDANTLFAKLEEIKQAVLANKVNGDKSNEDIILTREEAANFLKITLPTLHDWTEKGFVRAYRVGRAIRYKENEIINALSPIPVQNNRKFIHTHRGL